MPDLRCPMCGKPNPEDRETCQFCQARLKPLRLSSNEDTTPRRSSSIIGKLGGEAGDEEVPDWLRSLRGAKDLSDQPEPEELSPEEWGADLAGFKTVEGSEAGESESPDWLSSFRGGIAEEEPEGEDEPAGHEAEQAAPAWEPPFAASEGDDWLSQMRAGSDEGEAEQAEPEAEPEPGGIDEEPDWLKRIRAKQEPEKPESLAAPLQEDFDREYQSFLESMKPSEAAEPEAQPGAQENQHTSPFTEIPDWMLALDSAGKGAAEPEAETPATPAESFPDWLSPAGEGAVEPEAETPAESFPDWLSPSASKPAKSTTEDIFSADQTLPDWMMEAQPGAAEEETAAAAEPLETGLPDWLKSSSPAEEDTWLTDQEELSGEPEVKEEAEPLPGPMAAAGGGWQAEAVQGEAQPLFGDEGEEKVEIQPLAGTELPDWLSDLKPEESPFGEAFEMELPVSEEFEGTSEEPSGLAAADLPTWLEAMRPIESAAAALPLPEEGERKVESVGPLAGISGVLPAEADVAPVTKPPAYSVRLHISDVQQAHATLLESLVKAEAEARPLPRKRRILSQHVLRILIAVALFAAVLVPLASGFPQAPLPDFPVETFATSQIISNLDPNSPVLVAVDYEPGLTGEMEAAAIAVINHLMLKGTLLTAVSTSPSGPAQIERLLAEANRQGNHSYQAGGQYINLGFIPGGAAGLRDFAGQPRQTAPLTANGQEAWDKAPLLGIDSLSDYRLVLVITESPDTARTWIEQVQPRLGETPLAMVVSAQAEPLVRPYYQLEGGQVQGLVTGVAGGASYEKLTGLRSPAGRYWSAFSAGLYVAAALILAGGIFNAAAGLWARKKEGAGGEEQP